ncbi:hypothetical protein HPB48_008254 [Haemaphysalis longicornis]|uniref:Chitin-binding type-2 domain-containing protein n=1 Tax=Haemaphysalis longicornis TaxID=44386 RepID=A0A9J6H1W7_HAELO|nr:hypothetical protein HPB48_008254 [Haemaphysalis longicornis]
MRAGEGLGANLLFPNRAQQKSTRLTKGRSKSATRRAAAGAVHAPSPPDRVSGCSLPPAEVAHNTAHRAQTHAHAPTKSGMLQSGSGRGSLAFSRFHGGPQWWRYPASREAVVVPEVTLGPTVALLAAMTGAPTTGAAQRQASVGTTTWAPTLTFLHLTGDQAQVTRPVLVRRPPRDRITGRDQVRHPRRDRAMDQDQVLAPRRDQDTDPDLAPGPLRDQDTGQDQAPDPPRDQATGRDQARVLHQWRLEDAIPGTPESDYPTYTTIPKTSFDCGAQEFPAGYYADTEARCQVFHICQSDGRSDAFLCPVGTIFNQRYFVCDWWQNVNCDESPQYYNLNGDLYKAGPSWSGGGGGGHDYGQQAPAPAPAPPPRGGGSPPPRPPPGPGPAPAPYPGPAPAPYPSPAPAPYPGPAPAPAPYPGPAPPPPPGPGPAPPPPDYGRPETPQPAPPAGDYDQDDYDAPARGYGSGGGGRRRANLAQATDVDAVYYYDQPEQERAEGSEQHNVEREYQE